MVARTKDPVRRAALEAQLEGPPFPPAGLYLLRWWRQMRNRKGGGMGPDPIGWGDMAGFCQFTGYRLSPWEAEVISDLDDLWLMVQSETNVKQK